VNLKWFVTERKHGNARATGALKQLLRRKGWPVRAATARQVHGDRVVVVSRDSDIRRWHGIDGFLSDLPNVPLGIFTADCLSIFLASRDSRVIGVLHAGWRGVRVEIVKKALRQIHRKWGIPANRVDVWAGPAIGPCCFEVGWDVARYFPASRRRKALKWHVNLRGEIQIQVRRLGARWLARHDIPLCTRHEKRYHSFRRDQTDERQISLIMKDSR